MCIGLSKLLLVYLALC